MQDLENYILSALFFLLLCALFYLWKLRNKKRGAAPNKFLTETLNLALTQMEMFNLKLQSNKKARSGLSALLVAVDKDGLHMDVGDYVPEEWNNQPVEVFFRARREDMPVFYAFKSTVKRLNSDYENSHIVLAMPEHLRVEKKRNFMRVKPKKSDVRVIGVWTIDPGAHLPRSTSDIGAPVTHYKFGMQTEPVQVENISASGVALRFALDKDGAAPLDSEKGSHYLCLIVYVRDAAEKPVAFWCTGEVMNSREIDGNPPQLVLGLEFTNWAILNQGSNEIRWAHSSPTKGARPILQWVEKMDQEQAKAVIKQ